MAKDDDKRIAGYGGFRAPTPPEAARFPEPDALPARSKWNEHWPHDFAARIRAAVLREAEERGFAHKERHLQYHIRQVHGAMHQRQTRDMIETTRDNRSYTKLSFEELLSVIMKERASLPLHRL